MADNHLLEVKGKSRNQRIEAALRILKDLGGSATFEKSEGKHFIRGHGCPLAAATSRHPEACLIARDVAQRGHRRPRKRVLHPRERPVMPLRDPLIDLDTRRREHDFSSHARLTRVASDRCFAWRLAAGFLSAVADRFGLWGKPGTSRAILAWGDWLTFFDLHRQAQLVSARCTHTDRGRDCHARPKRHSPSSCWLTRGRAARALASGATAPVVRPSP